MASRGSKYSAKASLKRTLLDDCDSDADEDSSVGGACIGETDFKVNEDYARKFEHNKKRQEKARLEMKYGNGMIHPEGKAIEEHDPFSSSYETEDENGFLATEDLDAQISATLQAIRSKDPRVYDKNVTFVSFSDGEIRDSSTTRKQKPLLLKDYHRKRILRGDVGTLDGKEEFPLTHAAEQEELQRTIVSQIRAVQDEEEDEEDEAELWQRKADTNETGQEGRHHAPKEASNSFNLDVAGAEKNPETFLSNFLASRAWVAEGGGKWKAFESEDDDEEAAADEWEQAYNMRFEDPARSNEVLKSYARDVVTQHSARRKEKTSRQRQRELEQARKEDEQRNKHEEKARLRKLKLEESGEKLRKFKKAAGAFGKEPTEDEWMSFLDEAWNNSKWEDEMQKRFGEEYYAMDDVQVDGAEGDDGTNDSSVKNKGATGGQPASKARTRRKSHVRKPKWEEDIDIKDIIPDFEVDVRGRDWNWSDPDAAALCREEPETAGPLTKEGKIVDIKRAQQDSRRRARQERAKLEALVDAKLELNNHSLLSARGADFRYREASPQSFGLTARDILLAPSDKALNEFAGLKKLASFRDQERKRRDRKRLGKKSRLREWRRSVFGPDYERNGPTYGFEHFLEEEAGQQGRASKANNIRLSQSRTVFETNSILHPRRL